MADTNMTAQPAPVATNNAGTWTQTLNSGLSNALGLWMQVEQIRQVKSSNGSDQLTKQMTPELDNGSAIVVDPVSQASATGTAKTVPANSFVVNKYVVAGFVGLLVLGVVLKSRGFK